VPLIIADRVLEASTTTGTGVFTLTGASLGFRSFASVCSVADTVWYYIEGVTAFGVPSGEYEYGLGTYSGANQITRTTVRGSSNGGSPVNFSAGTKLVGISPMAPFDSATKLEWQSIIGSVPAGTVIGFANTVAPFGYLKANGAAVSRTTYAALFAAITTTWGVGDGSTTFNLPDLRGEFVRGWDDSRGIDSGRVFAALQAHSVMDHSHKSNKTLDGASLPYGGGVFDVMAEGGTVDESAVTGLITSTYAANRGAETRPRNIAMLYCIKY
jgi:microcystin-dependent protein